MKHGFVKVAATSIALEVANCIPNARALANAIKQCADQGAKVVVTPQLGICGATCQELLRTPTLLQAAQEGLQIVLRATADVDALCVVGLPISLAHKVYNCAAVLLEGQLLGLVAQTDTNEHHGLFAAAPREPLYTTVCEQKVALGGTQVFTCTNVPQLHIGVTIGEEIFAPCGPCAALTQAGATLLLNLAAAPYMVGQTQGQWLQTIATQYALGIVRANAANESSTHGAYAAQHFVVQYKDVQQAAPFADQPLVGVVDVDKLHYQRLRNPVSCASQDALEVPFAYRLRTTTALPAVWPYPFVPQNEAALAARVQDVLAIQANALAKRLRHLGNPLCVLGVSGGLDSTLALLVCCEAQRILHQPASRILGVTMPCFGTTSRTKNNALDLCQALGVPCRTVSIAAAVSQHLADIEHQNTTDVAYENAQARMRTMVLMDIANAEGGLVIGTGDMSEAALGWCTFNGDHMSMYNVNANVPKTLIRYMVRYYATQAEADLQKVLFDILDTPISPELLPAQDGAIVQKTEELIGSYDINDFILYYMVRWGMPPAKIHRLLIAAFPALSAAQAKEALQRFVRRFLSQQFKRACAPDSPRIGSVSLSYCDWPIPTDACATAWLAEIEEL